MDKQVIGVYDSQMETIDAIRKLTSEGYSTDDITVITDRRDNDIIEGSLGTTSVDNGVTQREHHDDSFWGKVKDFFEMDDQLDGNNRLSNLDLTDEDREIYNTHLNDGKYILAVEGEAVHLNGESGMLDNTTTTNMSTQRDESLMGSYSAADNNLVTDADDELNGTTLTNLTGYTTTNTSMNNTADGTLRDSSRNDFLRTSPINDVDTDATMADEERKMRLHEERLDVNKTEVQTGEVSLNKEVYEERESMDVPVMREEVYVERRPVNEDATDLATAGLEDEETIRVPIVEEQIQVTKKPVVTDEIVIGKRTIEETKHVSDTVRKEDVSIDKSGNPKIKGDGFLNEFNSTDENAANKGTYNSVNQTNENMSTYGTTNNTSGNLGTYGTTDSTTENTSTFGTNSTKGNMGTYGTTGSTNGNMGNCDSTNPTKGNVDAYNSEDRTKNRNYNSLNSNDRRNRY